MCEGFVGTMQKIGESCRHAYKAAHRSMAICRKWAMGTCIMLAYCMSDDSGKEHMYPSACEHDDDTVAEEIFGMISCFWVGSCLMILGGIMWGP